MTKIKTSALVLSAFISVTLFSACGNENNILEETASSSFTANSSVSSSTTSDEFSEVFAQDFTVINNTGFDITELYITDSANFNITSEQDILKIWGENLLTQEILLYQDSCNVTLTTTLEEQSHQNWSLMAKDKNGDAFMWPDLDLFDISELTLNYENGNTTATYI